MSHRKPVAGRRITVLAGLLASTLLATAAAAQERIFAFDLRAEPLADALRDYGKAADRQLIFSPELVRRRQAPAVRGRYSADEALTLLLNGTDLAWERAPAGGIMIVRRAPSSPPGTAAAASASAEPPRLAEVLVTGTHLRGAAQTSLLTQLSQPDLQRGGYLDLGQALRTLPGVFGGGQNVEALAAGGAVLDNANRTTPGASSVNLRGLGSSATLVLLNGNRLAPIGFGLSADISLVPVSAVERIDVLADGASSIYGADAVAGVVNIITRRRFEGLEGQLRYGGAGGGLETSQGSLTGGFVRGPLSGVLSVDAYRQDPLNAAKRERSSAADQPTNLFGKTKRTSAYASVQAELSPRVQVFADGLYAQRELTETLFTRPALQVTFDGDTKVFEYVASAGVVADLTDSWRLDLTGTVSRNVTKDIQITNSLAGVRLRAPVVRYDNRLSSAEAQVSGPLVQLPAGALRVAVGAAVRRERSDQRLATGRETPKRTVRSAYAEMNVPLVDPSMALPLAERLDLVLAGRIDDYSDFGDVAVPKIGLVWTPTPSVAVKASYSESFRAPSAFDLSSAYFAIVTDARASTPTGVTRVLYLSGTGRELGPERSENINASIVFEPTWLEGLRLEVAYYRIDYENRIALPDPNAALAFDVRMAPAVLLQANPGSAASADLLAGAFSVIPLGVTTPINTSQIALLVDARALNVASTRMEGFQGSATYRRPLPLGELTLQADVNRLEHFKDRLLEGGTAVERAGTIFSPPKLRTRLGAVWSYDRWESSLYWNHTGSYADIRTPARPRVSSWDTFDLSLSARLGRTGDNAEGPRVIFSVTNLTDEAPPEIAAGLAPRQSYRWDGTNASIVGRFASVTIAQRW